MSYAKNETRTGTRCSNLGNTRSQVLTGVSEAIIPKPLISGCDEPPHRRRQAECLDARQRMAQRAGVLDDALAQSVGQHFDRVGCFCLRIHSPWH